MNYVAPHPGERELARCGIYATITTRTIHYDVIVICHHAESHWYWRQSCVTVRIASISMTSGLDCRKVEYWQGSNIAKGSKDTAENTNNDKFVVDFL